MTNIFNLKFLFLISLTFLISINSNMLSKLKKEARYGLQPGDTIQFLNTTYSFSIPKGWKHDWNKNKTALSISPPNFSKEEIVNITVSDLFPEEKNMNITDLVLKQMKIYASMCPNPIKLTTVLGPQEIKLEHFKAGKYVADAKMFGIEYQGYIGAVKDEDKNKILFLTGAYEKKKSNSIRPGLDLILNSIKKKE